jgi:molybdate transport system regulatory protein
MSSTKPNDKTWRVRPRFRITRGSTIALGPGKADLLDAIDRSGSISGGAKALGMSYRRAWLLVETMNRSFARALVVTSGFRGKGVSLTPDGKEVLRLYREIESRSAASCKTLVSALLRRLET